MITRGASGGGVGLFEQKREIAAESLEPGGIANHGGPDATASAVLLYTWRATSADAVASGHRVIGEYPQKLP